MSNILKKVFLLLGIIKRNLIINFQIINILILLYVSYPIQR